MDTPLTKPRILYLDRDPEQQLRVYKILKDIFIVEFFNSLGEALEAWEPGKYRLVMGSRTIGQANDSYDWLVQLHHAQPPQKVLLLATSITRSIIPAMIRRSIQAQAFLDKVCELAGVDKPT